MSGTYRRSGIALDRDRLDHELSIRAVTARRLSEVAGVPEVTISRARHGRPVREATLRKLTNGLLSIPLMPGSDLLVASLEKMNAAALPSAAFKEATSASGQLREAV